MKTTNIKLTAVSIEDMLNDQINNQYNPSTWIESVKRFSKYEKCQFYLVPKDEHFSYNRFFVSYIADGLYFFSQWSAFSSSITSNGFVKAFIRDGVLYKQLFMFSNGEGRMKNEKEGRQWMRKNLTPVGIMVSNCI